MRFAPDSPLEEGVRANPSLEVGVFRAWELRHDSEAFMDDNRAEEGYFGLENGEFQSLPPGGFPCYLDPEPLISLFFGRQGF